MNPLTPDISSQLLKGYSWCVCFQEYDLLQRTFKIRVVDNPDSISKVREACWTGIHKFKSEPVEANFDEDCMDSIIGMHETKPETKACFSVYIQTEKYSIFFESERPALTQDIPYNAQQDEIGDDSHRTYS